MIVINFSKTRLRQLTIDDIEMARQWRNSHEVQKWMEYQKSISPEDQNKWFKSLEPSKQFYFVLEFENVPIGIVNIKNVNNHSGEGGIFIGESNSQNGPAGLEALIAMYHFGFNYLKLNLITAHIFKNNTRAVRLNKAIGFEIQKGQEEIHNQLYHLTPDSFKKSTRSFLNFLNSEILVSEEKN